MIKTLRIIGAGVKGVSHLTQEGIAALKQSKKIIWLGTTNGMQTFLADNQLNHEDITTHYQNGALDSDNYAKIKEIIHYNLNQYNDVALIVLGHPRLGVTIVQEFQHEFNQHDFNLQILPGISSFDTMINDLQIDPIEEGTCLLDVNRLILYDYQMDTSLNYFIYHICSIGNSRTNYETPLINNGIGFLKEKLCKHFPMDHKMILLSSSDNDHFISRMETNTLNNLETLLLTVAFDSSLFIPALLPKASQLNRDFYNYLMQSQSA